MRANRHEQSALVRAIKKIRTWLTFSDDPSLKRGFPTRPNRTGSTRKEGRGLTSGTMFDMLPSNRMTMKRRALLVGCNYPDCPDDRFKLDGCWNDVVCMREILISRFGFERDCICELVDRPGTDSKFLATGANIREMLHHSLRDLESGDSVVFHFSGHGVRLLDEGVRDQTAHKECIVPSDMNLITDDDFRIFVDKIPDGVAFTFIADCCHSGGLIAHAEQQVGSYLTQPDPLITTTTTTPCWLPQNNVEIGECEQEPTVRYTKENANTDAPSTLHGHIVSAAKKLDDLFGITRHRRGGQFVSIFDGHQQQSTSRSNSPQRVEASYGQQAHDHTACAPWEQSWLQSNYSFPTDSSHQGYYNHKLKSRGGARHSKRTGSWGSDPSNVYSSINFDNMAYNNNSHYYVDTNTMYQGYNGPGPGRASPVFSSIISRKNRSLPVDILTRMLSKRAGRKVEVGNILSNLYAIFTDKASITCKAVVKTVLDALKEGSRSNWMLDKFNKLTVQFVKSRQYDLHREINYHSNSNAIQPESFCPSDLQSIQLHPDRCVLLTACQSDESASDLKTNAGHSYGAFTNAILKILENHKWPIDNFRLVYEARHRLSKEYNQHPSLYSTIQNAYAVFICY